MGRPRLSRLLAAVLIVILVTGLGLILTSEYVRTTGNAILDGKDRFTEKPVAIVLGAAVWPGDVPSHMLEDRVRTAVRLLKEGRVSCLLMSGNREPGYDEPAAMRTLAQKLGVPASDILEDGRGWTTRHTMQNAAKNFSIRYAIIVTQSYHLPRAVFLARKAGLVALGVPADLREYRDQSSNEIREFFARVKAWLQEL
ncbi:MAG TPA: ElyC/SanA/YdcF family protein [Spirochaetota bacterium]|nr:ElyC/SanA/YdcF family protein [Spirochaetota bacterium]